MGPWGPPSSSGRRTSAERTPPRLDPQVLLQIYFAIVILSLVALAAGGLVLQRYEALQMGGVPTRFDRLTGELVGCVPPKGCFVIVPAGEPRLGVLEPAPRTAPTPAVPTPAPPPSAPAAAAPAPKK